MNTRSTTHCKNSKHDQRKGSSGVAYVKKFAERNNYVIEDVTVDMLPITYDGHYPDLLLTNTKSEKYWYFIKATYPTKFKEIGLDVEIEMNSRMLEKLSGIECKFLILLRSQRGKPEQLSIHGFEEDSIICEKISELVKTARRVSPTKTYVPAGGVGYSDTYYIKTEKFGKVHATRN